MNARPTKRGQTVPQLAVALGAIAVVGVAFAVLVSRPSAPAEPGATPSAPVATPRPSAPATPGPSSPAAPSPTATPRPSVEPSKPPVIDLESGSGHDVKATVVDQIGSLVKAESGHPGDGMSVRWHDALVKQVSANAVEITWVAFARDEQIGLGVNDVDGPLTVVIVQAGPYPNTDALGEDRVVVLTFDHAVHAADVEVQVLDQTIDE